MVNNGCSYIIDNFEHFNDKWLFIKKEYLYQKVPEITKFDHYRSSLRILGDGCKIQGQHYVELLQGSGMTAGYHYSHWILCI